MPQRLQVNEGLVQKAMKRVRALSSANISDMELRAIVMTAHSRNANLSSDEIAGLVAQTLGSLGGAMPSEAVKAEDVEKFNKGGVFDKLSDDAWK